jgi:hypothetical protein
MELQDFLVKAKVNTYASNGESKEKILKDGSKELIYKNANLIYRDRYFGFNPFVGEEIVFLDNKAIWGMNYYGKILSKNIDPEQLYTFLKKALLLVKKERPFRGLSEFKEEKWKYQDKNQGTLKSFAGTEEIYFEKKKVYELKYHGGAIER